MPNYLWWEKGNHKMGKTLPNDFIYASDINDKWLTIDGFNKLLRDSIKSKEKFAS